MKTMAVEWVPIKRVRVRGNIRDRLVELEQVALTQSVKENGILVPLLGHTEGEHLIADDGHRRLDAATRAGLDVVPMIVSEIAPTPSEILTLQLVANCQRSSLRTMQRVRAIDRLMNESGWPAAEVSLKLGGPSPATISKLRSLLVFPREVQDLIDAGRIPMSSAYAIATIADEVERDRLIHEVLNGRLTRDRLVAGLKKRSKRGGRTKTRTRRHKTHVVVPLAQGCSLLVGTPTVTLQTLSEILQDLLKRIGGLAQDMQLAEAAQALARKESFP